MNYNKLNGVPMSLSLQYLIPISLVLFLALFPVMTMMDKHDRKNKK